jgi:hypothetical protein
MCLILRQRLYCYCFLAFALHVSGTRTFLLGPWPNNTEDYLTPLRALKITRLKNESRKVILVSYLF